MCDSDKGDFFVDTSITRRSVVLGLSTVAAAAGLPTSALAATLVETDVKVKTADGVIDAVLVTPAGRGKWPAVLMWPDIFGLRPAFRDMARRLAASGYVVLVPNPFYRAGPAPVVTGKVNTADRSAMAPLMEYRKALTDAAVATDATALIGFLDRQRQVDRRKGIGVQGYCMGGPLSFQTAATRADRIRAVGSFHGGGLVTKSPTSPHLLIPKTKSAFLVAIARNDDQKEPTAKDVLKSAFAAAKKRATVEVYAGDHGWCVPGSQAYNQAAAERAWGELLRLYRSALA